MCEVLLAYFIVGAIEITPGTMNVDLLKYVDVGGTVVESVLVPTDEYLSCFE